MKLSRLLNLLLKLLSLLKHLLNLIPLPMWKNLCSMPSDEDICADEMNHSTDR